MTGRRARPRAALMIPLAAVAGACGTLPPPPAPPLVHELARDLGYLADPARQGRQLGTPGRDSAAAWIARRFEEAGLRPVFAEACRSRHPCPPGRWGQAFQLPAWALGGIGVNIAGLVPGADPALRHRLVVVGAHYDHIGRLGEYSRDRGAVGIRPGADDNASGTAAMLELARRMAARPPAMSVLFIAFDAEELGLYGSRHFLQERPVPTPRIEAMLNLDMVGRMRAGYLTVRNVGSAPWWRDAVAAANRDELRLNLEHGGGASDHVSFREAGIPAIHLYTGTHPDYHRRSDREERINYLGILRVVDFAERILRALPEHLASGAEGGP